MIESLEIKEGEIVLEVGTGSGIIALHCARAGAVVTATDIDPAAVQCAGENAFLNNLSLNVLEGDLFASAKGEFDVVIFNPPYLSAEDTEKMTARQAAQVSGGKSGAELSLRFLKGLPGVMKPGGRVYLLVSSKSEKEVLAHMSENYDFAPVREQRLFFERLTVYALRLRREPDGLSSS